MDQKLKQAAIELYDRFTHEGLDRRVFMARMVALAGSAAAAEALIGAIAASPAAAAVVPADDARLTTRTQDSGRRLQGLCRRAAHPLAQGDRAGHPREPRPQRPYPRRRAAAWHCRVPRRRAWTSCRRPAARPPTKTRRARRSASSTSTSPCRDAVAMLDELAKSSRGGKVGAVGFCWGGGFVNRLAVAAGDKLDAGVSFYGPAPDPAEAAKVQAPLAIHLAGLDDRVNGDRLPVGHGASRRRRRP